MALLLAGYFAQHYLPPPKPKIVGIDLGKYKYKMYTHISKKKDEHIIIFYILTYIQILM